MISERSTKRQQELLNFVAEFIKQHGYGPSYREVMKGLGYKSVSTVAIHVDGLIAKGYLRKRDNSARSLEVVSAEYMPSGDLAAPGSFSGAGEASRHRAREKWLVEAIQARFAEYRHHADSQLLDELYVLVGALKVLGFSEAYEAMRSELGKVVGR